MSEENSQEGAAAAPEGGALNELAKAVSESIPQPAPSTEFMYTHEHTAENTPLKDAVDPVSQSKGPLTEADREKGFSTIYLGTGKEDTKRAQELVGRWLAVTSLRELRKKGRASESMLATSENDWKQFVEKNFEGKSTGEMEERAISIYRFFDGLQDDILLRSRLVNEPDVTNVSKRSSKLTIAEIIGRVPGSDNKGRSIADVMSRAASRDLNAAHQYTVLLRNSFVQLTFERPAKLDSADLINEINSTVRGYVRRVSNNTVTLASIAGMKAVWEWFYPRIISSSVRGLIDYKDLANIIRTTDFFTLCNAILASLTDDGIGMDLRCINIGCDHGSYELIDPTKLTQIRPSVSTPEELAILGNIANGRVEYTEEEVLALIGQSNYGLSERDVYNETQGIRLSIAPPSFAEAFVTFDYFVGEIDPKLAAIRAKVVDENQLQDQTTITLNGLGATEYIQWVDTFTIMPPQGSDEEPTVLRRSESNPDEFNKGLMAALRKDKSLNRNLTLFVFNKAPYMTRTFSGIRNQVCPKCNKNSAEGQGDRQLGYTPIDSFMTFFTHTQLMLMDEAVTNQGYAQEALSQ